MGGSVGGFVEDMTGINMGNHSGADRARGEQAAATAQANATQRYIYDETRKDQQPWRQAGQVALGQLGSQDFQRDFTANDFQKDPGYDFRMAEGMKALERSAAARGGLMSGGTLKALQGRSQDIASSEYQNAYNRFNNDRTNRFNRLSSIAGLGQTANGQVAQAGQNYGNQVSANQIGLGNANAASHIQQAGQMRQMAKDGMTALAACDERLKTNIEKVSAEDMAELRKAIIPYKFNYIDDCYGRGDWVGPMAQDLQKTKLGKSLVVTDTDGFLKVDLNKVAVLLLSTMGGV